MCCSAWPCSRSRFPLPPRNMSPMRPRAGALGTDMLPLLVALVRKSMLSREPQAGAPRYRMLQTTRSRYGVPKKP